MSAAELADRQSKQADLGRDFAWSFMQQNGKALAIITALIEQEKIKPVIDRIYPLEQLIDAHEYMESRRVRGKVVISIADPE